ncbi:hypothetical protein HOF92_14045, partial [bacterium]|nr:hypothetical protein [bacterium]
SGLTFELGKNPFLSGGLSVLFQNIGTALKGLIPGEKERADTSSETPLPSDPDPYDGPLLHFPDEGPDLPADQRRFGDAILEVEEDARELLDVIGGGGSGLEELEDFEGLSDVELQRVDPDAPREPSDTPIQGEEGLIRPVDFSFEDATSANDALAVLFEQVEGDISQLFRAVETGETEGFLQYDEAGIFAGAENTQSLSFDRGSDETLDIESALAETEGFTGYFKIDGSTSSTILKIEETTEAGSDERSFSFSGVRLDQNITFEGREGLNQIFEGEEGLAELYTQFTSQENSTSTYFSGEGTMTSETLADGTIRKSTDFSFEGGQITKQLTLDGRTAFEGPASEDNIDSYIEFLDNPEVIPGTTNEDFPTASTFPLDSIDSGTEYSRITASAEFTLFSGEGQRVVEITNNEATELFTQQNISFEGETSSFGIDIKNPDGILFPPPDDGGGDDDGDDDGDNDDQGDDGQGDDDDDDGRVGGGGRGGRGGRGDDDDDDGRGGRGRGDDDDDRRGRGRALGRQEYDPDRIGGRQGKGQGRSLGLRGKDDDRPGGPGGNDGPGGTDGTGGTDDPDLPGDFGGDLDDLFSLFGPNSSITLSQNTTTFTADQTTERTDYRFAETVAAEDGTVAIEPGYSTERETESEVTTSISTQSSGSSAEVGADYLKFGSTSSAIDSAHQQYTLEARFTETTPLTLGENGEQVQESIVEVERIEGREEQYEGTLNSDSVEYTPDSRSTSSQEYAFQGSTTVGREVYSEESGTVTQNADGTILTEGLNETEELFQSDGEFEGAGREVLTQTGPDGTTTRERELDLEGYSITEREQLKTSDFQELDGGQGTVDRQANSTAELDTFQVEEFFGEGEETITGPGGEVTEREIEFEQVSELYRLSETTAEEGLQTTPAPETLPF